MTPPEIQFEVHGKAPRIIIVMMVPWMVDEYVYRDVTRQLVYAAGLQTRHLMDPRHHGHDMALQIDLHAAADVPPERLADLARSIYAALEVANGNASLPAETAIAFGKAMLRAWEVGDEKLVASVRDLVTTPFEALPAQLADLASAVEKRADAPDSLQKIQDAAIAGVTERGVIIAIERLPMLLAALKGLFAVLAS